jgi:hypothetical protein
VNAEVFQARQPRGLRLVAAEDRRTFEAPGLALTFFRQGDRWSHLLAVGDGASAVEIARAVEAEPDVSDPARVLSPTYQELHEHPVSEGLCVLLTGQATPHHFSAVVTARCDGDAVVVEFDVADRCREAIDVLAATYLVALGSSGLEAGSAARVAWSGAELGGGCLELLAEGEDTLALAEAGRRAARVQVLAETGAGVHTHRLRYRWRWSSGAGVASQGISH